MAMNYSAKVMDHFSNPRNVGEIENPSAVGEVGNAVCGDIMKIYLKIENNIITDVKFRTFGCGAAIATSSMATELIKGKSVDEALALTNKAVIEAQVEVHGVTGHGDCSSCTVEHLPELIKTIRGVFRGLFYLWFSVVFVVALWSDT